MRQHKIQQKSPYHVPHLPAFPSPRVSGISGQFGNLPRISHIHTTRHACGGKIKMGIKPHALCCWALFLFTQHWRTSIFHLKGRSRSPCFVTLPESRGASVLPRTASLPQRRTLFRFFGFALVLPTVMPSADEPYTCNTRAETHTRASRTHLCTHTQTHRTCTHTRMPCAHGRHTCISTHIGAHMHMPLRRTRISTYTGIPGTPRGEAHTPGHVPAVGSRTWAGFGSSTANAMVGDYPGQPRPPL